MSSNQQRTVVNAGRKPLQKDLALAALLRLTVPMKAQDEISRGQILRGILLGIVGEMQPSDRKKLLIKEAYKSIGHEHRNKPICGGRRRAESAEFADRLIQQVQQPQPPSQRLWPLCHVPYLPKTLKSDLTCILLPWILIFCPSHEKGGRMFHK